MLYTFVTALQALACGMILLSQILSTLQCAWTSISARRSNCLPYIVHLNPTEDFLNCLERVITPQSHRNVLVGDFNAENSDWYLSQGRDSAGNVSKSLQTAKNLFSWSSVQSRTLLQLLTGHCWIWSSPIVLSRVFQLRCSPFCLTTVLW